MDKTPFGYNVLTPDEVLRLTHSPDLLLLDVRTSGEFHSHRIPGVLLIPIDELGRRWQELDPDRPTVCICEHGIRSEAAAEFLARHDFAEVATMRGGMVQWTGPVERGTG